MHTSALPARVPSVATPLAVGGSAPDREPTRPAESTEPHPSGHEFEPLEQTVGGDSLKAIFGPSSDGVKELLEDVAAPSVVLQLRAERVSLREIVRLASVALAGAAAFSPIRYAAMDEMFRQRDLHPLFDAAIEALSARDIARLHTGEMSMSELLTALAKERTSWKHDSQPSPASSILRAVDTEWGAEGLAQLREALSPEELAELRAGELSPGAVATMIMKYRRHHPDVLILGAGAAGMSAGSALQSKGLRSTLLEARARKGGRTLTEEFAGTRVDFGGHWVHDSEHNVMADIARELGFHVVEDHVSGDAIDGTGAPWSEHKAVYEIQDEIRQELADVGETEDRSARDVVGHPAPLGEKALQIWTQMFQGVSPENYSTKEAARWVNYTKDLVIEEGMGTVVKALGDGLDVDLSTVVTKVEWSDDAVRVWAGDEVYDADSLIVTIPPWRLLDGSITFEPPLPQDVVEALEAHDVGRAIWVAFEVPEGTFDGFVDNSWSEHADNLEKIAFLTKPNSKEGVAIAYIGGDTAKELAQQGEDAVLAYARQEFERRFGPKRTSKIRSMKTKLFDGWSMMRPGQAHLRGALEGRKIGPLVFAGAAHSTAHPAIVPGAVETGVLAAEVVATSTQQKTAQ